MKKAIVGSILAIALLIGGCTGGGDLPSNNTQVENTPGEPVGKHIETKKPQEQEEQNKKPKIDFTFKTYSPKEVSKMTKEERYKELDRVVEEAQSFYFSKFKAYPIEEKELTKNERQEITDKLRQQFLIYYLHQYHVLAAKELNNSKTNDGPWPESKIKNHVWMIEDGMRSMLDEMKNPENLGGGVCLFCWRNYSSEGEDAFNIKEDEEK